MKDADKTEEDTSKFTAADFAIWFCFVAATFALLASAFVWLVRGQTATATVAAAIWALVTAFQFHLSRRKTPKQNKY